ncbi:MAG: glutamate 5-kinase [Candidatus Omnitrophica bacterium]|nr:glutamate 5-kinase [Candidatus Omnitrophota bacterium]
MQYRKKIKHFRRIVIKVGTSLLTEKGNIRKGFLKELVHQIKWLRDRGIEVVLVTSGAIGLGLNELGLKKRPGKLPVEQAAASIGQSLLMEMYHNLFRKAGISVGQVLLTQDDFRNRQRYLNAANTLYTLLDLKVIPIINENDAVAVDELHYGNKFGDNDILAALLTNLLRAELLIILTDVEGLYKNADKGEVIQEVTKITPEIERVALGTKKDTSRGGMSSKVTAARLVTEGSSAMVIASGLRKKVLLKVVEGENIGTLFIPSSKKISKSIIDDFMNNKK